MTGRLENCIKGADGIYHLTFATRANAGKVYDDFNGQGVEITVDKPKVKRSLNANAYMWELCGKIADKLCEDGTIHTKEDVYRETIKQVGVYRDIPMLSQGVDTLRKAWEMHGIGWVTEEVDYLPDMSGYLIRCYYGSSTYSSKQMHRLIQVLIQDCDSLGIEHRTPEEIANLLSLWEQERKQNG